MKILQLCHRVPYPLLDGGNIAMYQIGKSLLGEGHHLKILALNTKKHYLPAEKIPGYLTDTCGLETVDIDTTLSPLHGFLNLFSNDSYNISRFYSKSFEAKLAEILTKESYDIVQLESLFMTPYLDTVRNHSKATVVMRAHNVEHVIWQRLADSETRLLRRQYLRLLVRRLKRYESGTLPKLDAVLSITPEDKVLFQKMGYDKPVCVIPVGIDLNNESGQNPAVELSLFHLGSMDWLPNLEGVNWFLTYCWPRIHKTYPELKLFLAGRGFPEDIKKRNLPHVLCEGEIVDAAAYMKNKPIMIVPLLSGSGMRVKIVQGMAAGKIIISTSIGAEGIDCSHKKNILIADTPEEFSEAVHYCFEHKEELPAISKAAVKLVSEKYTGKAIGEKLDAFYKKLRRSV